MEFLLLLLRTPCPLRFVKHDDLIRGNGSWIVRIFAQKRVNILNERVDASF